jgi:hypothetical protein
MRIKLASPFPPLPPGGEVPCPPFPPASPAPPPPAAEFKLFVVCAVTQAAPPADP